MQRRNLEKSRISKIKKILDYHPNINNFDLIVLRDFRGSRLYLRNNKTYTPLLLEIQYQIHKHKIKSFLHLLNKASEIEYYSNNS